MGLLPPEGREGVNGVDNLVSSVWVSVKNLGVAINPHHGSATVYGIPDLSGAETVGNIVGKVGR
jgi:hypothetical protein